MGSWMIFSAIGIVIFLAILCLCVCMLLFTTGCFARKVYKYEMLSESYKAGVLLSLGDKTAGDKLDEIELHDVSMRLNFGESCYFEGEGYSYHSKEIVTGYRSSSHGRSIRVMKGYSIHRSNRQSNAIRETETTEYSGRLYITNERIVFLAERYGFDIGFNKLSNITMYNKYLEVFSGSKFFRVYTPHCVFIRDLITLMNICHEEQYPTK